MSTYYPDKWVLVEFDSPGNGKITKVMASNYGGYLGGDSWKLSSGVNKITKTEQGYEFLNDSGSVYFCHKDGYGMSGYTSSVYSNFVNQIKELNDGSTIRILDEDKVMDAVLIDT
jgi:hypothetical protein